MTPTIAPDLGPLNWVKGEIDQALARASEALAAASGDGDAPSQLRFAQTHVHQACGALSIVGLDGLARVAGALDQLLGEIARGDRALDDRVIDVATRTLAALTNYLEELAGGAADQALRLYKLYAEIAAARGVAPPSPADLFYPDLARRPPQRSGRARPPAGEAWQQQLRALRAQFQRGLLQWLRQPVEACGPQAMREAAEGLEALQTHPAPAALWWAAQAFFEALSHGDLPADPQLRQVCAMLDKELKQLSEHGHSVPDRLMRELLYWIGQAPVRTERQRAVHETWQLAQLLPEPGAAVSELPLASLLPALHAEFAAAKQHWDAFCAGEAIALPRFEDHLSALRERAALLARPALERLLSGIETFVHWLRKDPLQFEHAAAIEVATALLLAEVALDRASPEAAFTAQATDAVARLEALQRGEAMPPPARSPAIEAARRAHEKAARIQVTREMLANLAHIEQVLDDYFRNPAKRAPLAGLAAPLKQIEGALALVGDAQAIALVRHAADAVAGLAVREEAPPPHACEALAQQLSALGFYIDALQHGPANVEHFLDVAAGKCAAAPRRDTEHAPVVEPPPAASMPAGSAADEAVAAAAAAPVHPLAEDFALQSFDVIALADPAQTTPIVRADDGTASAAPPHTADDAATPPPVAEEAAATPAVDAHGSPAEVAPAAAADDAALDDELLAIFIDEAHEVLDAIAESLAQSRADRDDATTLSAVRRGFHTLKGSGRMVGLTDLGEAAWAIEQTLNRWLQLDWLPSPALHAMLERAHREFTAWVDQIEHGGGHGRDVAALIDAATALREPQTAAAAPAPSDFTPAAADGCGGPPAEIMAPAADAAGAAVAPAPIDMRPTEEDAATALRADEIEIAGEDLDTFLDDLSGRKTVTQALAELELLSEEIPLEDTDTPGQITLDDAETPVEIALAGPPEAVALTDEPTDIAADVMGSVTDERRDDAAPALPVGAHGPADQAGASERLRLGDREISRTLFELFVNEAREQLGALQQELGHLRRNPVFVPAQAAVRAAHTLAGIAGTAGVHALHQLARALEHALERVRRAGTALPAGHGDVLLQSVVTMDAMLGEVTGGDLPIAVPELEEQLAHIGHDAAAETVAPASPQFAATVADTPAVIPADAGTPSAQTEAPAPLLDDLDAQLLPLFLDEGNVLLGELHATLRDWRTDDANPQHAKSTARLLHTLKGSARMTGAMTLGELVHRLESRLEAALRAGMPSPALIDELVAGLDEIERSIEALAASRHAADAPAASAPDATAPTVEAAASAGEPGGTATLRVRADTVDHFVNTAGEIGIARTRIEGELRTVRRSLLDLTENVIRLRNQLREVEMQAELQMQSRIAQAESQHAEFDPLEMDRYTRLQELTRMLAESVGDVTTVQQNLLRNLDGAELALAGQARLSRDLQQSLMQVRMVPFDSLADRLHRVVRQSAKELGKRVNLDVRGGRTGIDRSVLERMTAPLEHLLRNAVVHGIESPQARRDAGKEAIGQITVSLAQEGNEIAITLADDGAGLDHRAITAKARSQGLLGDDEPVDERRLAQFIFMPGFSTADSVSTLAGRGVGMDVVKSETAAVGGRIDVRSVPGQGTEFCIHLPQTLAVTQALLVQANHKTYAVPSSMITQVLELKADALDEVHAQGGTTWQGEYFACHYLPELLGERCARPEPQRFNWLLLLRAGAQTLALHVDALKGSQEIIVKHAGPQLTRLIGISGATVLGDGEIVLILNPVALASRRAADVSSHRGDHAPSEYAFDVPPERPPTVMVVDDSLTVRKITGRLLEREGYRVITAKDGSDALEQLLEDIPDVILTDIEMPRMDGFDLVRNIRADVRTQAVPVIMITSRLADKHREYAMKVGANHYLGKPYDEAELLGLIERYTTVTLH